MELPSKLCASGALILNDKSEILIVKPGYKEGWEIPGGIVEKNESPIQALFRELREEINITVNSAKLILIDWKESENKTFDKLLFIFYVESFDKNEFKIDGIEIIDYKYISLSDIGNYFPEFFARRITSAYQSIDKFSYCEYGIKI